MTSNTAFDSGREYKVRDDQNILSRTDTKGRITYAAQAFVEVSGYSREELIGSPHSIVRHPDMPKEAFSDLWKTLGAGECWVGLVKNRRKNGDFYWVRAHLTPIIENGVVQGYTSVRVRPTDDEIKLAEATYAKMRAGNSRGIKFDRGQIVETNFNTIGRFFNLQSLQIRLWGATFLNIALLFLTTFLIMRNEDLVKKPLLELANEDPVHKLKMSQVVDSLITSDYIQLGILLTVGFLSVLASFTAVRLMKKEIRSITDFSLKIAAGDMAANNPNPSCEEFKPLAKMLAVMQRSLVNISVEIRSSLRLVRPIADQVVHESDELAVRTEQQAASLQQTATSMEEITATVLQNAENAHKASGLANSAADEVAKSGTSVHELVARMDAITESSRKITEIVGVIDGIAFQTNILALNASIEAARAGEQGKGFAVVANEVRHLATRSARASSEVRSLVEGCCREIDQGGAQVAHAENAISTVVDIARKVNSVVGEIAIASEEQRRSVEQINIAIAQMDEATQRNAGMVAASAKAAHSMEHQVGDLTNSIDILRLPGNQEVVESTKAKLNTAKSIPKTANSSSHNVARAMPKSASVTPINTAKAEPKNQYRNDTAETAHMTNDDWESF